MSSIGKQICQTCHNSKEKKHCGTAAVKATDVSEPQRAIIKDKVRRYQAFFFFLF